VVGGTGIEPVASTV